MECVKPYPEVIYLPTGTAFWPSTLTQRIFLYVNSSSSFDFQNTKYHRSVESSKLLANAFASFRCCPVVPRSQTNIFIFAQAERKRAVNIFDTPMMAMAYHIQLHMGFTSIMFQLLDSNMLWYYFSPSNPTNLSNQILEKEDLCTRTEELMNKFGTCKLGWGTLWRY